MKVNFQQQLDHEFLHSERKRAMILIALFSAAFILRLITLFFIYADSNSPSIETFYGTLLFPVTIILFELCFLFYINTRIKARKKRVPKFLLYLNIIVEVSLPSVIILFIAKQFPSYDILQSPAVSIYFIFIILSTLRLNFVLSVFCGLLSAASYVSFSLFLYVHFDGNDAARTFILIFSGVAAGFIAKHIRAGIDTSLREIERRHKVEDLFGQQLSTEVVNTMLENNGQMKSKKMNVAIMFIDIRNFSFFAANSNPEEIVQYQNAFFSIVINTVAKHHGIIHQFLGDGCMITFGAPGILQNPSQHAVNAGIDLLENLDKAIRQNMLAATRIGIGIHTGEVVTGNIGTAHRQQYSITGNPVILASRIEQFNKQFDSRLLVSKDVIHSLKNESIAATFLGKLNVKGWLDPVPVYKLA